MIVFVATPLDAVSLPVPVTVPAPEAFAKATTVELSDVTVLPAASWIVAVSTRVAPEVRSAVAPVSDDVGGGTVDDGEGAEGAGRQSAGGRLHRDRSRRASPVTVLVATPLRGGRVARAADGAGTGGLGEGDDGGVVGGDGVAGRVLDRRRQQARRAEVRSAVEPVERDLGGGAVDDGEGAERAGGQTGGGRFHRHGADERAGDRLGGDTARGGGVAGAGDGAGAGGLGEGDDGGVVGGDGVAGGVLERGGEDAGRRRRSGRRSSRSGRCRRRRRGRR